MEISERHSGLQVETEKSIEELNDGLIVKNQHPEYIYMAERV